VNPLVKANYLASPPLVVAYALAGTVAIDLQSDPLGKDPTGQPVFLRDIWPTADEIRQAEEASVLPEMFTERYAEAMESNEKWNAIQVTDADLYSWDPDSTYIQEPPFLVDITAEVRPIQPLRAARVLAVLGDSVTTDHISPAGAIPADGPAGRWLREQGVSPESFNTLGSRRGHHQVMARGTFGNVRIKNKLVPGREGNWTRHHPSGDVASVFDTAERYQREGTPLLVLGGKEYGTGSSRDGAAKGPALLGVRAVIAESFERIHRSNLVGMGVLPLELDPGVTVASLGLDGSESFDITGIGQGELRPRARARVRAEGADGRVTELEVLVRIDTASELEYFRHGGILRYVLRRLSAPHAP
jgi:aconitate hydratase